MRNPGSLPKDSYAPICSGCHTAHSVKPISAGAFGQGPEAACFGCHADVLEAHQKWLPNAALHFEVVSCPACHVPGAQRNVDLMLIDSKGNARGTEQIGVPLFDASAKSDGKGIDAQALYELMQTLNRSGIAGKTILRGRLDVIAGPQAHRTRRQEQGAQRLPHLSPRRFAGLPERDHLAGRAGRPARRLRRQRGRAELGLLGQLGERLLCDRRHPDQAARYPADRSPSSAACGIAVGHVVLGWMFKRFGLYHPHNGHGDPPAGGDGPKAAT